jgi:hypothetical protein
VVAGGREPNQRWRKPPLGWHVAPNTYFHFFFFKKKLLFLNFKFFNGKITRDKGIIGIFR